MNTTLSSTPHPTSRALVFGGAGGAGYAWEIGVVAGLFEAGLDVTDAELMIGTSAGSTVAAQLRSAPPAELFAGIVAAGSQPRPGSDRGRGVNKQVAEHLEKMSRIIAAAESAADLRRRLGAAALELEADPTAQAQRRAVVASRLASEDWPERLVRIVAVDARTGEPVVFDRDSGVDLADAVTASTAGPGSAGHSIGDNRYIDGGYRRNENADLAAGYGRVLVLSPFGGRTLVPLEWGSHLAAQVDELRAGGSRVETIFPDGDAREIFAGTNQMDPSTWHPAARAGHNQGQTLAEHLTPFWR